MSMDALTNAALDNLHKIALPKLVKLVASLHEKPAENRELPGELKSILKETVELLSLLTRWGNSRENKSELQTELSPDDAAMIAAVDGITENLNGRTISPDDAAMIAAVDGSSDPENMQTSADMSDEEARKLLDAMDSPVTPPVSSSTDMSDDDARKLLESMDAPVENVQPENDNMSDDEARMLLADMDTPVPTESTAPADISDEEARRLLDEMDAPSISATQTTSHAAANKPIANNDPTADEAALAMLAQMDGLEDHEHANLTTAASKAQAAPQAIATQKSPNAAAKSAHHEADSTHGSEDLDEIPEWESNDFASDPEMMNDFTTNSADIMQKLDDNVLSLEQDPSNKETIEEIFRAAHTLKGAAGMFSFRAIERVMHRMENLFDNVRKGKLVPNSDTIDAVFQGLDCLKKLLAAVLAQTPSGMKTAPIVRMLELASAGKPSGASRAGASAATPPSTTVQTAAPTSTVDDHAATAVHTPTGGGGSAGAPGAAAGKKKSEAASTIRVDLERLDALVNLIGELVIDRTRFVNIDESLRIQAPHLKLAGSMTETLQQFGRHMNEIQDIIMKVRMVPVGSVFNKYPRIVRDLARQLGKQIDLVVVGEETEFDKTLVEQIADPLVHLIRNACDHGVETPDIRQASGKAANGTVTLSARQEGNHIIIQITDDGKGMDVARIKAKGIEKGLITADQNLTDRDIFNLIFEPGFSTAEKVTTVSGRGVGMDVVKKQIAKLKGMVEITSAPGKGSTITIQLPLTLAIMQSLLVGIQEEVLAIPLNSVVESIRIKPSEIQKVGDCEVIKLRNTVLPLMYLDEVLGLEVKSHNYWYRHSDQAAIESVVQKRRLKRSERLYVVVVGTAERRYGLVVDALLNQQEMVIKPLGPLMRGTPCVAGGAVLGNGEVVLVMDIPEIETYYRTKKRAQVAA
jgi:two-component system chemotaxis sensor kinase CheA